MDTDVQWCMKIAIPSVLVCVRAFEEVSEVNIPYIL